MIYLVGNREYNNQKLTDKMNYILKLTKSNKTEEEIKQMIPKSLGFYI